MTGGGSDHRKWARSQEMGGQVTGREPSHRTVVKPPGGQIREILKIDSPHQLYLIMRCWSMITTLFFWDFIIFSLLLHFLYFFGSFFVFYLVQLISLLLF